MWHFVRNSMALFLVLGVALYAQGIAGRLAQRIPQGYALAEDLASEEGALPAETSVMRYYQTTKVCRYEDLQKPAKVFSTVGDPTELLGRQLLTGRFYREAKAPEENRYAVIDESLAVAFFMETDVCGRTFAIDGTVYQICGVLKGETGAIETLAGTGEPVVYIPASSPQGSTEGTPLFWCAASQTTQNRARAAERFSQYSGRYVDGGSVVDLLALTQWAEAMGKVAFWFIPVSLAVFVWAILQTKIPALSKGMRRSLAALGVVAVAALQVGTLFYWMPASFLPADNVFDLEHYFGQLVELARSARTAGGMLDVYITQSICSILGLSGILLVANLLLIIQSQQADRRGL